MPDGSSAYPVDRVDEVGTMRNDAEAVVEGLYAAWALQDIDATLSYCADTIQYTVHQPEGITGLGGQMLGKAAVRSYLEAVCARWEFEHLAPVTLTLDGNEVRGQMRYRTVHRRTGQPLAGIKRVVFQIECGLIAVIDEYHDAVQIKAFLAMVGAR